MSLPRWTRCHRDLLGCTLAPEVVHLGHDSAQFSGNGKAKSVQPGVPQLSPKCQLKSLDGCHGAAL